MTITCSAKSLLSASKKLLTKILNLLFQDHEKRKSIVCKAHEINLLKISPFCLCYGFLIHSNVQMIFIKICRVKISVTVYAKQIYSRNLK